MPGINKRSTDPRSDQRPLTAAEREGTGRELPNPNRPIDANERRWMKQMEQFAREKAAKLKR